MSEIFLTYGQGDDNNLIHISDAKPGVDCGLSCPFCEEPLVARKGNMVAHHFDHRRNTCQATIEVVWGDC